ncbi:hypothetical protein [Moorena sp. SIO3I8]|uniref:hypothetical protein n=1 Tax=Moorena sp. SIO3I8 TaxID=2607833 RepID=UPI0025FE7857|nr:hypothetical protein [Moorena sp. SIO3I8]
MVSQKLVGSNPDSLGGTIYQAFSLRNSYPEYPMKSGQLLTQKLHPPTQSKGCS